MEQQFDHKAPDIPGDGENTPAQPQQASPPPAAQAEKTKSLKGIYGWLLVFAIYMLLQFTGNLVSLLSGLLEPMRYLGTNSAVALIALSLIYAPGVGLAAATLILLLKHKIKFRLIFIIYLGYCLLLMIFARDTSSILGLITGIGWMIYLLNSKRVRVTCGLEPDPADLAGSVAGSVAGTDAAVEAAETAEAAEPCDAGENEKQQ